MTPSLLLAAGLAAIFIALFLVLASVGTVGRARAEVGRSLAAVRALDALPASMKAELDLPFTERVLTPALQRLTRIGRALTPVGRLDRIRERLELAGSPAGWDVERVLAMKVLGLVGGGVLVLALTIAGHLGVLQIIFLTAAAAAVGYFAPTLTLRQIADRRTARMRKELPDALDLLSISVEAGLGFDAALAQVARNTVGPLAEEFFRVLQEMQIGESRASAMRSLGERTSLPELRGFVSAMVQADSFGIPIVNVLRVQASEMRLKRSQLAEERAQKLPVKLVVPLIFGIMPALFTVIVGPAVINIIGAFSHGL